MVLVVVVVFPHWTFFTFRGYFFLPPALHSDFPGSWRPPPALSHTLATFGCFNFCQAFPSQFYCERYGFEWAFFTHRRFLPYAPSLTFLKQFVTQMQAGTPHPGSSTVPARTELSLPADAWTWISHIVVTRPLIYQLRHWATKYGVKVELLNIFRLFKVISKDTLNKA